MNKFSYKTLIALLCSLFIFAGCIDENFTEEPTGLTDQPLLSNVIAEQSDLSTFNQLVDLAGLRGRLVGNRVQDQRAVFAPTNEAIANFLAANDFASANDVPELENVVAFHIANANVQQSTLAQTNFTSIQTIATKNISVTREGGQILLNNQAVNIIRSITDVNGTIHVIDQVLVP
ncbi:MAG TPA: fasciclin domain-containing protein [Anditalea sp.]|nr:fasciclin domain-containing protein [Anditalea sp.]